MKRKREMVVGRKLPKKQGKHQEMYEESKRFELQKKIDLSELMRKKIDGQGHGNSF